MAIADKEVFMRDPMNYKTRYGLYRGTISGMDVLSTTKRAWWLRQALYHCEQQFPDMLPQLRELIHKPTTLDDLAHLNEVKN